MKRHTIYSVILFIFFFIANVLVTGTFANAKQQDPTKKDIVCNALGCEGGLQRCVTITTHLDVGIPGVLEAGAEITYYCYQEEPGGDSDLQKN